MAYYTLHAYDADVRIPFFTGLRQDSEIASDLRFAIDEENVETPNGVLQPQAAITEMEGQFDAKVETIARFHRRWYDGGGTNEWLVCAAGGKIYCRQANDNIGWVQISTPIGMGSFQSNVWSWITYEDNVDGVDHPIDVLFISNAKDGMYMVIPPDRPTTWGDLYIGAGAVGYTWQELKAMTWEEVYTEKWTVAKVNTTVTSTTETTTITKEYLFGIIERHKERIWATDIMCVETVTEEGEDPVVSTYEDHDKLMYSAVYRPGDWRAYPDPDAEEGDPAYEGQPEDGAGDILQPSWDGDKFTALKTFGDQLIAFKESHVWRVMGVSPGEYTFTEQYGGGTMCPNTIAVDVDRIFMVERDGISIYDGMTVSPFNRPYIEKFWRTVNRSAMDQMCAAMFKHRYYIAVPTGNSEVNNTLVVFNTEDGSFLVYTDIYIESLMPAGDVLYATTSNTPGKVFEINYNSWETGLSSGRHARWETPWMDFNYKTIAKGGYEIYFNPEVKGYPVTFKFTIQTEKKSKSKEITIQPTTFQEKQKKIRFGGTSRRFKLIIEVMRHPSKAVWRLTGGIHMVVETDPD